jgi:UDP-N-acetylglucosamine 2-epimerase (non-hydrolysing)
VKSIVIAGARPNFVKVAPLLRALRGVGIDTALIHTGQHYDWAMSESLFRDLGIGPPDVNLGIGSGSHAVQTARVMLAFDEWLDANECDQVITVGDVNSSMACTLVAIKRHVPVAHVEAGLRAFDRTMPEEINRVVVDRTASWLFTPSNDADENLLAEGVQPERIHLVGNIMVDSLLANLDTAMAGSVLSDLGVNGRYGLVTLHRPALVDDPQRFQSVMTALSDIARELPLIFPVHPRTRAMLAKLDTPGLGTGIVLTDPLGYLDFLQLEARASLVLTDSGGVQEETTVLGVPCLTLRENTERPVTISHGTNRLVGFDAADIRVAAIEALGKTGIGRQPPLWDGHTAERVAAVLAPGTVHGNWMPPVLADRAIARGRLASVPA